MQAVSTSAHVLACCQLTGWEALVQWQVRHASVMQVMLRLRVFKYLHMHARAHAPLPWQRAEPPGRAKGGPVALTTLSLNAISHCLPAARLASAACS